MNNSNNTEVRKLNKQNYHLTCKEMALYLLGKLLVRKLEDGSVLSGRIVETECYLGDEDKASHSYGGRRTPRNQAMYMEAGTAYVYITYGMYHCFNISSLEPGAAVLLRALEPLQGFEFMEKFRSAKRKGGVKPLKVTDLCNGPSKLCIALNITKQTCNKLGLGDSELLWLEDDGESVQEDQIVMSSRIGIASAGEEWAQKQLRFYVLGNLHVSKRDKVAEKGMQCGLKMQE